ncbi:tma16 [Acrasis kona]|uniref:Tma16 n=1 Tax=Acrasis kona TaxID=1008807 RepID=A0AAW2YJJ6_9EUKA
MPKEDKVIHPRSRKATYLQRAAIKGTKKEGRKAKLFICHKLPKLRRFRWMKEYFMKTDITQVFTDEMMEEMLQAYLKYVDEKLAEEKKKRRGAVTTKSELDTTERDLYESAHGIDIVDLTDKRNCTEFFTWDGEPAGVPGFKVRNYKSKTAESLLETVWKEIKTNQENQEKK